MTDQTQKPTAGRSCGGDSRNQMEPKHMTTIRFSPHRGGVCVRKILLTLDVVDGVETTVESVEAEYTSDIDEHVAAKALDFAEAPVTAATRRLAVPKYVIRCKANGVDQDVPANVLRTWAVSKAEAEAELNAAEEADEDGGGEAENEDADSESATDNAHETDGDQAGGVDEGETGEDQAGGVDEGETGEDQAGGVDEDETGEDQAGGVDEGETDGDQAGGVDEDETGVDEGAQGAPAADATDQVTE